MEQPSSFGEWLRRQRRALDLTQDELAKRAGCASGTIRKIEADELRPSKQLAEILAQRLDIPPDQRGDFVRCARGMWRDGFSPLPIDTAAATRPAAPRQIKLIHNLPIPLTSFIGRERERVDIKRLLLQSRLLTLTGAGGCGKTRLAIEVARNLIDEFPDGVWWVDLAPVVDPALVPRSIASVLGVREEARLPLVQTLVEYLHDKNLLLALDNCERLIEACAQVSNTLLQNCPQLRVLATSCESLGMLGENLFHVPALSLPVAQEFPSLVTVIQSEAVRLFLDRAASVEQTFALTATNVAGVTRICRELDGIPLAIELAAACVRDLSVEMIAAHLSDRFHLLTRGNRTALPHHQTLRALIDWSYDSLSAQERVLLRRLSLFAGGWTLDAAEEVCSGDSIEREAVLDLHSRLVNKSLVIRDEQKHEGALMRYRMLETIRQFGHDKAIESGENEHIRNNHLNFFLKLAEQAESKMQSPEQLRWFERIDLERDNLQAALDWSQTSGQIESGLRIMFPLFWYFKVRGYWIETFDQTLHLLKQIPAHSKTLGSAGALATAGTLCVASLRGDAVSAEKLLSDSIASARDLGAMGNRVLSYFERAIPRYRTNQDKKYLANTLGRLGDIAMSQGNYIRAREYYEESLVILRVLARTVMYRSALDNLGRIARLDKNYAQARALHHQSLALRKINANKRRIADSLEALGALALAQGQMIRAARLLSASQELFASIGAKMWSYLRAEYESAVADVRAQLGESTFQQAWAEGRALTMEQAIEYALEDSSRENDFQKQSSTSIEQATS